MDFVLLQRIWWLVSCFWCCPSQELFTLTIEDGNLGYAPVTLGSECHKNFVMGYPFFRSCGAATFTTVTKRWLWLSEGTPSLFGHLYYKQENWEPSPRTTTAVAHTFRAFASHAEGWVFKSQTSVIKTGSDSSAANSLATGVSVTGLRRLPL